MYNAHMCIKPYLYRHTRTNTHPLRTSLLKKKKEADLKRGTRRTFENKLRKQIEKTNWK